MGVDHHQCEYHECLFDYWGHCDSYKSFENENGRVHRFFFQKTNTININCTIEQIN